MTYSFRQRVILGETAKLPFTTPTWRMTAPDSTVDVFLRSTEENLPLAEAREVQLVGAGYASADDALRNGEKWCANLVIVFAMLHIGADFGDRAAKGFATESGLRFFAELITGQSLDDRPVLNDTHGLMVYKTDPRPRLLKSGPLVAMKSSPEEVFEDALQVVLLGGERVFAPEHRVAYDLYSASFFHRSADARLALLMMAVETLISARPRAQAVREHVERLIELTRDSDLPPDEKRSIGSTLKYLRNESINQAGQRLARILAPRKYQDLEADKFFSRCYKIRSDLFHGNQPIPSRLEVDICASVMELFVGDLISMLSTGATRKLMT